MSLPEVLLWQRLRGGKSGVKFRRQHPIGPYVADFYCSSVRLAVEVDGQLHEMGDHPMRDARRDRFFADNGYVVLRIPAVDVLRDPDGVAASILAYAADPLHHRAARGGPPPRPGEDGR